MKPNLTKKQLFSTSAIIVAGAVMGAAILLADGAKSAGNESTRSEKHAAAKHEKGEAGAEHGPNAEQTKPEGGEASEQHVEAAQGHKEDDKEAKVALDDAQVKAAGIAIQTAGAAKINTAIALPGEIRYNEDKTAHVVPRLAGVVQSVRANLGQKVKKGEVLAVIASTGLSEQRSELLTAQQRLALATTLYEREKRLWQEKISAEQDYLQARQAMHEAEIAVRNARQKLDALGARAVGANGLASYEVRAPFDGMVMEKHLSLGEAVKEDSSIFTLSDLSTVWAEVAVPAKDLAAVRVGAEVTVTATAFDANATGTLAYVGSLLGEQTRTAKARIVLANPDLAWRPGLFVNVDIVSQQTDVPVAVAADAIQTVNDKPTVFVHVPGGFVPKEVALGRSDGKTVEITMGLESGSRVASSNSFILKSELGKASAEHAH
jgi:cobalt-zinc-cadmium efflux system membrane fusion protein